MGLAQVGVDLRLFEMIRDGLSSQAQLATEAKVDPVLMSKYLPLCDPPGYVNHRLLFVH